MKSYSEMFAVCEEKPSNLDFYDEIILKCYNSVIDNESRIISQSYVGAVYDFLETTERVLFLVCLENKINNTEKTIFSCITREKFLKNLHFFFKEKNPFTETDKEANFEIKVLCLHPDPYNENVIIHSLVINVHCSLDKHKSVMSFLDEHFPL